MKEEREYKVILIGDSFVGKTSLINKYCTGKCDLGENPTVATSYVQFQFEYPNKIIKLNVWDTAGHEKFQSLVPLYARTADVLLVVFDLSNNSSFQGAKKWLETIQEEIGIIDITILCGNKYDLINEKNFIEYEEWSSKNNLIFTYTSALTGFNVQELFEKIADKVKDTSLVTTNSINLNTPNKKALPEKSGCCK